MASEVQNATEIPENNVIDPNVYDVTMSALLIGLEAENYIDIFRNHNIGQCTLMELTDEDLIKLGVDNETIRVRLLEEVKNLPIYQETIKANKSQTFRNSKNSNLGPMEIIQVLEESSQHLYRIYLSMMTNTLALKKAKTVDSLIYNDKYASNVALTTLSHMTNILNSMDIALHTQIKVLAKESNNRRTKKAIVGTVGTVIIGVLTIYLVRSLKQLQ